LHRGGRVAPIPNSDYLTPEARARVEIDEQLRTAGWAVQDADKVNLAAAQGVAVREFLLKPPHGRADYLLFVDRQAVGSIEAKPAGTTLTGVEIQSAKYRDGLPDLDMPIRPLPFAYEATGVEARFTNRADPEPRSRAVFWFHRPATLAGWIREIKERPAAPTLRHRLRTMPLLNPAGLWPAQARAIENLERSLREDRPRALIQMATGAGKTFTAANIAYRLIKHAGARRVLFLVDRANLGRQTRREFEQFTTPDDGRKFTDLYNVQPLAAQVIDPVARVCISTIQRMYSILRGEPDLPTELDEASAYEIEPPAPVEVAYNPAVPIETFDVIVVDECHRSIYNLWRQVLEYFDAYLIGLTATPSKITFGFFHQNLVMEYPHEQAVADGVNVDFDVYKIRTEIGERGSTIDAGIVTGFRHRETRQLRWEQIDEPLTYDPEQLDRKVVAPDQIRTVIRTFRDRLFTDIFPDRTIVPKTLIFAKDDSHAEDIVQIVREEFGKGNEFATKITYKTKGKKTDDLIGEFRNSYNPRIAVTVDMIATGTDVKPLECLLFMRAVRSRTFFEQMKGRGVRVIDETELRGVTRDARAKTRFVIVDAVGVTETALMDTAPLERRPTVAFDRLLNQIAIGVRDPDMVSSVAARLARLSRQITKEDRADPGGGRRRY
jgi:type I restriction enzyme R subunit